MKLLPFLILIFFPIIITAQDTIYLDQNYEKTTPANAAYYQIDDRKKSGDQDLIRYTYKIDGQLLRLRSFKEKRRKLSLHGLQKSWYDTGQLFYQETYRKGERDGELLAYWKDGSKRRHDSYKRGKLTLGKVWNKKGEEEEHFPVMIPAEFPGGPKAISDYLRDNLPVPETQQVNTIVRTRVKIRIGKEGYIDKIEIIEGAPHYYNAILTQTLANMPKWNPGSFMGDPVNVWFTLPVTFRK